MAQHNENSLHQVGTILEFLMERKTYEEKNQRKNSSKSPTYTNKECQCDLYETEHISAIHNSQDGTHKNPCPMRKKLNCASNERTAERSSKYLHPETKNTTTDSRCICCNSEMIVPNRSNCSYVKSSHCCDNSMQRRVGGENQLFLYNEENIDSVEIYNSGYSYLTNMNLKYNSNNWEANKNCSNLEAESKAISNSELSKTHPLHRISTHLKTINSSTGNDKNFPIDNILTLTETRAHVMDQEYNSIQNDNDTSGYVTEPEDNVNSTKMNARSGGRKRLSSKSANNERSTTKNSESKKTPTEINE